MPALAETLLWASLQAVAARVHTYLQQGRRCGVLPWVGGWLTFTGTALPTRQQGPPRAEHRVAEGRAELGSAGSLVWQATRTQRLRQVLQLGVWGGWSGLQVATVSTALIGTAFMEDFSLSSTNCSSRLLQPFLCALLTAALLGYRVRVSVYLKTFKKLNPLCPGALQGAAGG